jgi:shikimate dehydrogenase
VASPEPGASPLVTIEEARAQAGPDVSLVGVIGSPIAHSLSPLLHTAAFAALGLDATWHSQAFEVAAGEAALALGAMRRAGVSGLSVTMPHKADVAGLVDECTAVAQRLGAVNCIINRDGHLVGTNTDGQGFVASLARGAGFVPAGKRCLVIGAGGAARAVVLALAEAGASEVAVLNRTPERAAAAAALAGAAGSVAPAERPGSPEDKGQIEIVGSADLVVNATPLGMAGAFHGGPADWLVAPNLLHPGQVAADLVYVPRPTRWLAEAAAAGALPVDGLGMLVHQAAAQLELWTGQPAAVEAMWQAAEAFDPSKPSGARET